MATTASSDNSRWGWRVGIGVMVSKWYAMVGNAWRSGLDRGGKAELDSDGFCQCQISLFKCRVNAVDGWGIVRVIDR